MRSSLASGSDPVEVWPKTASLSVTRGSEASLASLASTATREEAFLIALQQQIAQVGAGAPDFGIVKRNVTKMDVFWRTFLFPPDTLDPVCNTLFNGQ